MGAPSASVGGYSGLHDVPRLPGAGLTESVSPSTVTLNDPSRQTSARIGATLYQAPTPYSGFSPTQNVVSAASYPTNDRGERVIYDSTMPGISSLPLQQEITYGEMQQRSSMQYDEYDDDFVVGGRQPPHHFDGPYQGEIRLNTMSQARPLSTSRSDPRLAEQETRFGL